MSPESGVATKSPEVPFIAKDIALEFSEKNRFSGVDSQIEFQGKEDEFTLDLKRPFNGNHNKYYFKDQKLCSIAIKVNLLPGSLFKTEKFVRFAPSRLGVSETMVLSLVRMIKQEEQDFRKNRE